MGDREPKLTNMKKSMMLCLVACLCIGLTRSTAQSNPDWNTAGNATLSPANSFLGTTDAVPINFRTSNVVRSRLYEGNSVTINTFAGINQAGYWGLARNATFFTGVGSFSRLHIADLINSTWQGGFRPNDVNGITMTGNNDHLYIGQWVEPGTDHTSMLLRWSDQNPDAAVPDMMRFAYTEGYNNTASAGDRRSLLGKEIAVLHPLGRFGIGDFRTTSDMPSEALDVRIGNVRVRDLYAALDATANRVAVVNPSGVVSSKDPNKIDCKWKLGSDLSPNDLVTGVAAAATCPSDANRVSIGTTVPTAKLTVVGTSLTGVASNSTGTAGGFITAITASSNPVGSNTLAQSTGLLSTASQGTQDNVGVDGRANLSGATGTTGLDAGIKGEVDVTLTTGSVPTAAGVWGRAISNTSNTGDVQAGVAGFALGTSTTVLAGYFSGNVTVNGLINGVTIGSSDSTLKTNIVNVVNPLAIIQQMQPKSFQFRTSQFPRMGLLPGTHIGFLAQQLQPLLPGCVVQLHQPAFRNDLGVVTQAGFNYLGVNYNELSALAIAGIKQQQTQITQLQQQVATLLASVAACCPGAQGDGNSHSMVPAPDANDRTASDALRIAPNPTSESTTITYTVAKLGHVALRVSTSDGRPLKTLREEEAQAGTFAYEWNMQSLAAGTYICTLSLDGAVVVQRVVKVEAK